MKRRRFLSLAPAGGVLLLSSPAVLAGGEATGGPQAKGPEGVPPAFPRQESSLVREVVSLSHRSLEGVRRLVDSRPALAKASWDWGFGDWESALGAASHTGQRDIALYLMDQGARPDVFTFAMLGKLEAVRALVEARPGLQRTPGPHGITLLSHARAGGNPARPVVDYLESLGNADVGSDPTPLSDEERRFVLGSYTYGPSATERFTIETKRSGLVFSPAGGVPRGLTHLGGKVFHPAGAPAVTIAFEGEGRSAASARIRDGALDIVATRES